MVFVSSVDSQIAAGWSTGLYLVAKFQAALGNAGVEASTQGGLVSRFVVSGTECKVLVTSEKERNKTRYLPICMRESTTLLAHGLYFVIFKTFLIKRRQLCNECRK